MLIPYIAYANQAQKLNDFKADLTLASNASWLNSCVDTFSQAQYDDISADFSKNSVGPIITSRNLLAIYVWGYVANFVMVAVYVIIMILSKKTE